MSHTSGNNRARYFQMCVHPILKLLYYSTNCTSLSPATITNWELFTTIGSEQLSYTTQLWGVGVEPPLPCLDCRQGISGLTRHLNGRGKGSWRLPTTYIAYFTVRNWSTSCLVSSHTYIKSGEGVGLDCTDVHSFRRGTWNIAWIIGVNSAGIANRNETTYGPLICLLTLKQT